MVNPTLKILSKPIMSQNPPTSKHHELNLRHPISHCDETLTRQSPRDTQATYKPQHLGDNTKSTYPEGRHPGAYTSSTGQLLPNSMYSFTFSQQPLSTSYGWNVHLGVKMLVITRQPQNGRAGQSPQCISANITKYSRLENLSIKARRYQWHTMVVMI